MSYLTLEEYKELGFAEIEEFSELKVKAEMAVDLYTNYFYQNNNLEDDFPPRKKAVKLAIANQIRYLNETGILTAEDKHSLGSLSIGRTTINYDGSGSSPAKVEASKYNLALDTINLLKSVGFGYRGVYYDR
nr:MAG TPA: Putative Head Tail Connector Protein [Caudoviricetes sp.]